MKHSFPSFFTLLKKFSFLFSMLSKILETQSQSNFLFSSLFKFIQDPLFLDENLSRLHIFSDHSEFKNKARKSQFICKYICVVLSMLVIHPVVQRSASSFFLPEVSLDSPFRQNLRQPCTSFYVVHFSSTQMCFAVTDSGGVGLLLGGSGMGLTAHHSSPQSFFTDIHTRAIYSLCSPKVIASFQPSLCKSLQYSQS